MTRRFFALSLAASAPALRVSGKSWDHPAFPNWDSEFVDKMLTDSPWARDYTAKYEMPVDPPKRLSSEFMQIGIPGTGGWPSGIPGWPGSTRRRTPGTGQTPGRVPTGGSSGSVRTEAYLIVRWATALPVRRARAIQEFGRTGLASPGAVEVLQENSREYVIEIAGIPTMFETRDAAQMKQDLERSAKLYLRGRRPLTPTEVKLPEHGMHLMATLRFPRFEDVDRDGIVEVSAQAGPIKIQEEFKLKTMVYNGRLEL